MFYIRNLQKWVYGRIWYFKITESKLSNYYVNIMQKANQCRVLNILIKF